MRRVVVTGMGQVSPIGNNVESAWRALLAGKSGIVKIPELEEGRWGGAPLPVTIAGTVKGFQADEFMSKKEARKASPFIHFTMAAASEAWKMARLPERLEDETGNRAGAIIGVGLIGISRFLETYDTFLEKGPKKVSPFFIPAIISNLAPGHVALKYNLRNSNFSVVSACASGAHGIGEAFRNIQAGRCDLMVAGGAESPIHPLSISGFASMHALCANQNNNPEEASRPFDKNRSGFVMSEGAGVLILESLEHALEREAPILAEMVGYGSSSDAHHITTPAKEGEGAQRAMRAALSEAELVPAEIDYINAHGTSTYFNDLTETQAIKSVFGEHASKMAISSTKSSTGHLLGAAGGVEAIFSIMSIRSNIAPPTLNYETPDPECDLDYVPNKYREKSIKIALSNSFGFGGTNAVLVFKSI